MTFNEHALEMSIMELFEDEGYEHLVGSDIHREKTEVLLVDDIKNYLYDKYADDEITPSEVESIILMLRSVSGNVYEVNKRLFVHICG